MSFVGKLLVGLQLVLSICLMAFAAAVSTFQTNWKGEYDKAQKNLQAARTDVTTRETELKNAQDKFNADLKKETDRADIALAQSTRLQTQVDTLTAENKQFREQATLEGAKALSAAEDDTARQKEAELLRELLKKTQADRDKEYAARAKLEDEIFNQKTRIAKLEVDNKSFLKENKQYRDVLIANGLPFEIDDFKKQKAPPPRVFGQVKEVRPTKRGDTLIRISIGENDGLSKDHVCVVYRKGAETKYLGKIRILSASADEATGELIEKNGIVREGDDVATKLD